jgi:NhaA family Na+:H+ antiporter
MARRLTIDFLRTEAGSGLVLAAAAALALLLANSPTAAERYVALLNFPIDLQVGSFRESQSFAHWVKNGLMAIFFLVVGMEIKFEVLKGELSNPRRLALPLMAALGGIVAPAALYIAIHGHVGGEANGWPIPIATDLAAAMAILAAVGGRRLPSSLRIFLLTVALADNVGALVLIAFLFTAQIQVSALIGAGVTLAMLALLGRWRRAPYFFYAVGFVVCWAFTLKSGIDPSLAGVACAMTVPTGSRRPGQDSVLSYFMDSLHGYVAFGVLPLYAFTAAGFHLADLSRPQVFGPLPLAVLVGLIVGKPLGVMGMSLIAAMLKIGRRPSGSTWLELAGVAFLSGVGFTLSLFLGALAFPESSLADTQVRLGVIAGSLICAGMGALLLTIAQRRRSSVPV